MSVPRYTLVGEWDEISETLTRLHDANLLFDFAMHGWTADPSTSCGHIEAKCVCHIYPDDDDQAAMMRLMFDVTVEDEISQSLDP